MLPGVPVPPVGAVNQAKVTPGAPVEVRVAVLLKQTVASGAVGTAGKGFKLILSVSLILFGQGPPLTFRRYQVEAVNAGGA